MILFEKIDSYKNMNANMENIDILMGKVNKCKSLNRRSLLSVIVLILINIFIGTLPVWLNAAVLAVILSVYFASMVKMSKFSELVANMEINMKQESSE